MLNNIIYAVFLRATFLLFSSQDFFTGYSNSLVDWPNAQMQIVSQCWDLLFQKAKHCCPKVNYAHSHNNNKDSVMTSFCLKYSLEILYHFPLRAEQI